MPRINAEYREDAKKKIIAAAIEIATEKSWDAVTLEAIARKVGVTKGALYAYFDNSEALLREVILTVFCNIRIGLEETLARDENIHGVIRDLAELVFEKQKPYANIFFQLPIRLPQDSRYREEFAGIFDNNRILIRDCLARMKKQGQLSGRVDPDAVSNAIIALTMGLRISSLFLGKDPGDAKKVWIDSVERLLLIEPGEKEQH